MSKKDRLLAVPLGSLWFTHTCEQVSPSTTRFHCLPGSCAGHCCGPCCPGASFQETNSDPWLPGHVTFYCIACLMSASSHSLTSAPTLPPAAGTLDTPQPGPSPGPIYAQVHRRETCLRKWVRDGVWRENTTDCTNQGRAQSDKHSGQHTLYRWPDLFLSPYAFIIPHLFLLMVSLCHGERNAVIN